jgi:hypothetical protein
MRLPLLASTIASPRTKVQKRVLFVEASLVAREAVLAHVQITVTALAAVIESLLVEYMAIAMVTELGHFLDVILPLLDCMAKWLTGCTATQRSWKWRRITSASPYFGIGSRARHTALHATLPLDLRASHLMNWLSPVFP